MMNTNSPLINQTPNTYVQVFNCWKDLYDQLVSAFDYFLAESKKLDLTLQPDVSGCPKLEEQLASVDAALTSLSARMCNVRAVLGKMRNQSRSLVPLRKFPDEIVAHILSLVKVDCITKYRYSQTEGAGYQPPLLANISFVNKWLRDIATSTPSLWTHIDLAIGEPYEEDCIHRGRSYLRYSGEKLLQVHVIHTDRAVGASAIVKLLAPHAHRIVSLDLQTVGYYAKDIVFGLFSNIDSCQLQECCLNDLEDAEPEHGYYAQFFDGRLGEFFRSLRIIAINGPELPMDSVAFHNLVALSLSVHSSVAVRHTIPQLKGVLAACPALCALSIISYGFDADFGVSVEPTFLPNLESLDL
ncbi:hypothetical protein FRC07_003853 [Ceratobasidium sp. 392]|nr:hypothetical protein FRC07_003853 [Ceratobasidium sp. 392]